MFFSNSTFVYRYTPILAISPAEMSAIEELPEKDKNLILPVFPLRGWVGSQKLDNTLKRIEKAIGTRFWIANIDESFLTDNKEFLLTGKYPPRDVFNEIEQLINPHNGYENWCNFIDGNPSAIPTVLWGSSKELSSQIEKLNSVGRGLVLIISPKTNQSQIQEAFRVISDLKSTNVFVMLDFGQVSSSMLSLVENISNQLHSVSSTIQASLYSISASSFPSSFSGYNHAENSIYERNVFNKVRELCRGLNLVYSDRGSARADKINGGGGVPSPRIDYPLKNEWKFIRKEFEDWNGPADGEKEELYSNIAKELMDQDYWMPNLRLWGTQLIELTSKSDEFGINSPIKATAARINIHLHTQLHYDSVTEAVDTDDDWID